MSSHAAPKTPDAHTVKPRGKIVYSFLLVLVSVGLLPLGVVAYKLIDISREALVTSQQEVQLQVAAATVRQLNAAIATVRDLFPQEAFQTLRLSAAGEDSSVLSRLKTELSQRTGLAVVADEGDLLLRLRRAAGVEGWEVLVRLSPRPLATRAWRVCNMPGALNATLAHCMMRLSAPADDDATATFATHAAPGNGTAASSGGCQ